MALNRFLKLTSRLYCRLCKGDVRFYIFTLRYRKMKETLYYSFEEKYIPSPEVRQLIKDTDYQFSDRDKAAIIWNSRYCLLDKYGDLRRLALACEDDVLAGQIRGRLAYDGRAIRQFSEEQGYIYLVDVREKSAESNVVGYYKDAEAAYGAGKKTGFAFRIEKHQILGEGTDVQKARFIKSPLIESDESRQIEEYEAPGSPAACFFFTGQRYLSDYWSNELPKEDEIKVNTLSRDRFENAYVVIPNPFERGDRVQIIGTDRIGTVAISQEDWKRCVAKALAPGAIEDWVDASITVLYAEGKWDHDHVNPIFLTRVILSCFFSAQGV